MSTGMAKALREVTIEPLASLSSVAGPRDGRRADFPDSCLLPYQRGQGTGGMCYRLANQIDDLIRRRFPLFVNTDDVPRIGSGRDSLVYRKRNSNVVMKVSAGISEKGMEFFQAVHDDRKPLENTTRRENLRFLGARSHDDYALGHEICDAKTMKEILTNSAILSSSPTVQKILLDAGITLPKTYGITTYTCADGDLKLIFVFQEYFHGPKSNANLAPLGEQVRRNGLWIDLGTPANFIQLQEGSLGYIDLVDFADRFSCPNVDVLKSVVRRETATADFRLTNERYLGLAYSEHN